MSIKIVTIFDKNYLARALAFYESAIKHINDPSFLFICSDGKSGEMLKKLQLKKVELKNIDDINDTEFVETKKNRTPVEYMITAKSCWMNYLVNSDYIAGGEVFAFFDPDIYFFSSPDVLIDKIRKGGWSISITPHRFPANKNFLNEKSGRYNAGIIFFRKDEHSKKCLKEWSDQCKKWCLLKNEDGKIGDQGYLNDWPNKYDSVFEIPDKGFNLGTWNIEKGAVKKTADGNFKVFGETLICYHFHGFKAYFNLDNSLQPHPISVFHHGIYKLYAEALQEAYGKLQEIDPSWYWGTTPNPGILRLIKQEITKLVRIISF